MSNYPYPGNNTSGDPPPYPGYPPSQGGSPYPPQGGAPYPPQGGAPYPPQGGGPYTPQGGSPYPPPSAPSAPPAESNPPPYPQQGKVNRRFPMPRTPKPKVEAILQPI